MNTGTGEGGRLEQKRDKTRMEAAVLSFFTALSLFALCLAQDAALLPALLVPVVVHELGHLLALILIGYTPRSMEMEPRGLMIRYDGLGGWLHEVTVALSGPLAGLLYALVILQLPGKPPDWLSASGSVSLLLTGFNLLPILPLDGGRVLEALCMSFLEEEEAERLLSRTSGVMLALLLLAGTALLFWKKSAALLAAGLWLLLENERLPLVKGRKLL